MRLRLACVLVTAVVGCPSPKTTEPIAADPSSNKIDAGAAPVSSEGSAPELDAAVAAPQGTCPTGMAAVVAGTFPFGDKATPTTVAAHCIDKLEVTVADYEACVTSGKCKPAVATDNAENKYCNSKKPGREKDPINCVDHTQATAYCASLGKRLPTEAEWEWSARGYAAGTRYPWGNEAPADRACWDGPGNTTPDDREGTCPVGAYPKGANPAGVLDLAGGVWEWTSTPGKDAGAFIDKGGCFANSASSRLMATDRNALFASFQSGTLGFRCAK